MYLSPYLKPHTQIIPDSQIIEPEGVLLRHSFDFAFFPAEYRLQTSTVPIIRICPNMFMNTVKPKIYPLEKASNVEVSVNSDQ